MAFDKQKTLVTANAVIAALKKTFNVEFDDTWSDANGVTIKYTPGQSGAHSDNQYVLSPQNLSKVIDPFFRDYRSKGWTFTQPSGGSFSIGVPAAANESLQMIRRIAGLPAIAEAKATPTADEVFMKMASKFMTGDEAKLSSAQLLALLKKAHAHGAASK